jgi:hypothetical protein
MHALAQFALVCSALALLEGSFADSALDDLTLSAVRAHETELGFG